VAQAKNKLPELLRAVEAGQVVTICRRGVPIVDLVCTRTSSGDHPKFGSLKDRIKINEPEWWKAMTDEEVDAFLKGRY
jgi:antitoxin (DNA-binding transcriptional repressor) of toxin-antitoxin stability system